MSKKRVHILSTVNASSVSKAGSTYTIRDVCGAVDNIVMHNMLYPGDQLAKGAATLEGKPAPAGHPRNSAGQCISALDGRALASSWIGSYCHNARHEGGRTLVDIVVNETQAKAHPDGLRLVERLDAAISRTNSEPIHVSTGVTVKALESNGESRGKKYSRVATDLAYDHLAILLNEAGAGTPDDGVGMFLNAAGEQEEVERVVLNNEPEDRRNAGLMAWVWRLLGNASSDVSIDQLASGLSGALPDGAWLREVSARNCIWVDREGRQWQQSYEVNAKHSSVAFAGQPVEVKREVSYTTVNHQEADPMKDKVLAALNAAGIAVAGLDDAQLLGAYNALVAKPHTDALVAANSKIAGLEIAANAATEAELTGLATELATNSSLSVDDLKKLGLPRLKELKAVAKAAPIVVGNAGGQGADEFSYDMNTL